MVKEWNAATNHAESALVLEYSVTRTNAKRVEIQFALRVFRALEESAFHACKAWLKMLPEQIRQMKPLKPPGKVPYWVGFL